MRGKGVLAIWHDVAPEDRALVDEWHLHEHLAERVDTPGFLRARRYEHTGTPTEHGAPFFTLYETKDVGVLASEPYLDRLEHPTPLTQRAVPLMGGMQRAAMTVVASVGRATGGMALTFHFQPDVDVRTRLLEWLEKRVEGLRPSVVAAHLLAPEEDATKAKDDTAEGRITAATNTARPWMVLVEAVDHAGLDDAAVALRTVTRLGEDGGSVDSYRLTITLLAPR